MRGYFGVGVENISKPMNLGNLQRSAHAFGAAFFFTIASQIEGRQIRYADTSDSPDHLPTYHYGSVEELRLPQRCRLVGVELTDDAVDLPRFPHPVAAAYLLGPERGSLSPEALARCEAVVKIPTRFCVNLGVAGAIVLYDRHLSLGPYGERGAGGRIPGAPPGGHVSGGPVLRRRRQGA